MERKHKFRAWDTLQGGKFEYWDSKTNKYDGIFWEMIKNKSFKEPNEFTGLKDKNGKEIYEGDVLKWNHACDLSDNGIDQVVFRNGLFGFEVGKGGYALEAFDREFAGTSIEVIGNIYENPELIK
jgi:uncharacterized phage protein (TIGR01671 family)